MISIRTATENDIIEIYNIEKAGFDNPWTVAMLVDCITDNVTNRSWLAEVDGKVAGFLINSFLFGYDAEIYDIAVAPEFRKQGVATFLINYLIEQARVVDIERILLEVRASNEPAKALYNSLGFKEDGVREKYYENGEDAILMSLNLK